MNLQEAWSLMTQVATCTCLARRSGVSGDSGPQNQLLSHTLELTPFIHRHHQGFRNWSLFKSSTLAFPVRLRASAPSMKAGTPISHGWRAAAAAIERGSTILNENPA